MSVRFHPAAEAERFAALEWYAENDRVQATGLAMELRDRFRAAIAQNESAPRTCPPHVLGSRRCLPYALVFDIEPEVVVLAVAHSKRRPGSWAERRSSGAR